MRFLIISAFFIPSLLCICMASQAQHLQPKDFFERIDTASNAIILDVRTPEEFNGGHIKNALNIDYKNNNFSERADSLVKAKPVYIYCLSGGRSAKAASCLRSKGYTAYELDGGMLQWRAAGLPEEKPSLQSTGLTLDDYAAALKSHPNVLFDFYADWCGPCKRMEPYLNEIGNTEKSGIKVIRINVDENPKLAAQLKIDALPTLHYYKNSNLRWGYIGYLSKKALLKKLKD